MTPHLLLYTDDPGLGGVAQYNHSLLLGLLQRGYRVSCAQLQQDNPLVRKQQAAGVQHLWLDAKAATTFEQTLIQADNAFAIFTQHQPNLIIFSDACPLSNFAAKRAAMQLGLPFLVVEGFVAPYLAERFASLLDLLAQQYHNARAVIAVSQENLEILHQQFRLPADQGQVIYYGRPASYFRPRNSVVRDRLRQEMGIPQDAVVCFTAARLDPVKGFQYQLEAIAHLKQESLWEQLYFVWAGDGPERTLLAEQIAALGVGDRVLLLGQRWDVADWLDTADIFVFPSKLEGMPLAVMEAMARGLPVVASAVSGIPEELGETGKLLTDPKIDAAATVAELVETLQAWVLQPDLRAKVGQDCKQRAEQFFQEQRMVQETVAVVERSLIPPGDYVSPGLSIVLPDGSFPHMVQGNPQQCGWEYLRQQVPHNWYVDQRHPFIGFLSRDEAHILYNTALKFKGKRALEIGCWKGWSACHLALAGVILDVVDPLLAKPDIYESVCGSLQTAGVLERVNLVAGYSPQRVQEIAADEQRRWSLIFIDGNHDAPGPLQDAIACEQLAEPDALIVFHDLASPEVAQGLDYLRRRGWQTLVYQTMQIMGVAWRGNVEPLYHQPDPTVDWELPSHLQAYAVSGLTSVAPMKHRSTTAVSTEMAALPEQPPLISIVIPCPDQAQFLVETIGSVLTQDYLNWEILIVDDGSTDDTVQVAQHLIERQADGRIRLIQKANGGSADARNVGIAQAQGEYILPLDGTDLLAPGSLKKLVHLSLEQSQPCVVFGSYQTFGTEQKLIKSVDLYLAGYLRQFNMLRPGSLYPKSLWQQLGGYKLGLDGYEDWEFWLNCQEQDIAFHGIPDVVLHYRKVGGTASLPGQVEETHDWLYAKLVQHHPKLYDDQAIAQSQATLWLFDRLNRYGWRSVKAVEQSIQERYLSQSGETDLAVRLKQLCRDLMDQWSNLPTELLPAYYTGACRSVHQLLCRSDLQELLLAAEEQDFVHPLIEPLRSGQQPIVSSLLAVMLYFYPHQLEWQPDLTQVPEWMLEDYLHYLLTAPPLFRQPGEAEQYHRYLANLVASLHQQITADPESPFWQQVAQLFTQWANFIPLYFTETNLKTLYLQRAGIMAIALRSQGHVLDYEFPDRPSDRSKIRLGVLAAHFTPQTETFSTLPAYKHLNREDFEIILFSVATNGHRLERYCAGHADALIGLPTDLSEQVQVIRKADLDILLISTNITAVSNAIAKLALHRLARIQVVNNSSCTTSGMATVDSFISGTLTEVETASQQYSETLVLMEGPAHCYDLATEANVRPTQTLTRADLGIGERETVYISGANFYKITPEVERTWATVLVTVPHSRLVLYPFNPNWSSTYPKDAFLRRLQLTLTRFGLSSDRVIVLDAAPSLGDVKERVRLADVYLNAFPFSGVTSLLEPLMVGVPPLVMDGQTFRSRMGAAFLRELGVPELVVPDEQQYQTQAIALATQPELRRALQQQIQRAMGNSPRFLNSQDHSAQMGRIFERLFQQYQQRQLLQSFRLRQNNLVIFPDWNQPDEDLFMSLIELFRDTLTRVHPAETTLLVDAGRMSAEEVDAAISSVVMHLLMEEGVELSEVGPEITALVGLTAAQWQVLMPQLSARIEFEWEDEEAIARAGATMLPLWTLQSPILA